MKYLNILFFVLIAQHLFGQNSINIQSKSVEINSEFRVDINFTNSDPISAFQFDLNFDSNGIDLTSDHELFDRANNHSISTNKIGENTLRVVVYSGDNSLINAGNSSIIGINFLSKNSPGTYNFTLTSVVVSGSNGSELEMEINNGNIIVEGANFNLNTSVIDFGNVPMQSNQSRDISITNSGNKDLEILSMNLESPFSINNTFPITVSPGRTMSILLTLDTSSSVLVNRSISFETNDADTDRNNQLLNLAANVYSVNEISIGNVNGNLGELIQVPVSINNMDEFNGFQIDIVIPEDLEFIENSVQFTGRQNNHLISNSLINDTTLRVIAFSSDNRAFSGDSGSVFQFTLVANSGSGTKPLEVSNSIISDINSENVISDSYDGSFFIKRGDLNISRTTINLGDVAVSSKVSSEIILTNNGNSELVINEIKYGSELLNSSIFTPLVIPINSSITKEVIFSSDEIGDFFNSITIKHNGTKGESDIEISAKVFSPNYLFIEDKTVYANAETLINLSLFNNKLIRAIQFDINMPEGFEFKPDEMNSGDILEGFDISFANLGNNNFRIIIYSLNDIKIVKGENTLLELPIFINTNVVAGDYNLDISNVVISDISNQNVLSTSLEIGTIHILEKSSPIGVIDEQTLDEDSNLISINVIENDKDPEDDELTIKEIIYDGSGSASISIDKLSIEYKPELNFNGKEFITYSVTDGTYTDKTVKLIITVNPINDKPIAQTDNLTINEDGDLVTINIISNDIDVDEDELFLSNLTYSGNGDISINPDNKSINYKPEENFFGTEVITYSVSDGVLTDETGKLIININPLNDIPLALEKTVYAALGNNTTFTLNAIDVDNDPLTYYILDEPNFGAVLLVNNEITY
ncbi:MAG: tandem-95 repeat protein, partial [Polaribacter sp.]